MIIIADVKMYDVQEVATMFNVHVQTVRKWIHKEQIKARRIGKGYYITESEVKNFSQIETEEQTLI